MNAGEEIGPLPARVEPREPGTPARPQSPPRPAPGGPWLSSPFVCAGHHAARGVKRGTTYEPGVVEPQQPTAIPQCRHPDFGGKMPANSPGVGEDGVPRSTHQTPLRIPPATKLICT